MEPEQWFYTNSGKSEGPVTPRKLKELAASGTLTKDDLIWKKGLADWVVAGSIKALFPNTAPPLPASSTSPPPIPSATVVSALPPQSRRSQQVSFQGKNDGGIDAYSPGPINASGGKASQNIACHSEPQIVFAAVQRAMSMMGKVTRASEDNFTVKGTCKYGLQKVKVEANVAATDQGTVVSLVAICDDVWTVAAKNALGRLLEALQNLDNPNYVAKRNGASGLQVAMGLGGFLCLFILVGVLPNSLRIIVGLAGFGLLAYFMKLKKTN